MSVFLRGGGVLVYYYYVGEIIPYRYGENLRVHLRWNFFIRRGFLAVSRSSLPLEERKKRRIRVQTFRSISLKVVNIHKLALVAAVSLINREFK